MHWIDKRHNKTWMVGDTYWIYDDGRRVIGEIVRIEKNGCVVKWPGGIATHEGTPEPASDWWKMHGFQT